MDSSEQGITDDSCAVPYDLDAYPVTPDAKSFDLDTCGTDSDIELSDFCLYDTNPDFKIAYSGDDEEEEQIQKFFLQQQEQNFSVYDDNPSILDSSNQFGYNPFENDPYGGNNPF